jgi:hypothetical protein
VPNATCDCDAFQGREYRFCREVVTFDQGAAACQVAGMTLIRVDSAEENTWLLDEFTARGLFLDIRTLVFLGGTDGAVEGEWRWPDGTLFWDGAPVGGLYNSWMSPPSGARSDCLGMHPDGYWVARTCNSANVTYACEGP